MEDILNGSVSLTNGFVDETSITSPNNLQMDVQDISIDSRMSDPLNVDSLVSNHKNTKDANDFRTRFQKDSLVFAKLSGHSDPPWPARVANVCWKNGIHCEYEVFFYGTYQVGIVSTDKIWAYDEKSVTKFAKPKISSLRRRADFSKGLAEIRDCPEIAPSRDIQESASQIARKLIRRTAIKDDLKHELTRRRREDPIGEAVVTSTPERKQGKVNKPGVNLGPTGFMAGIREVGDKDKTSSWILSKSSKNKTIRDESTDDEIYTMKKKRKLSVNNGGTSSVDDSNNNNTARRSTRTKKVPYWRRLEVNCGTTVGSQKVQPSARLGKVTKTSPGGGMQTIATQAHNTPKPLTIDLRNKVEARNDEEEKRVAKVTGKPSPAAGTKSNDKAKKSTKSSVDRNPTYRSARVKILPRPLNRSSAKDGYSRRRLLDAENALRGNEEALENSNPTVIEARYTLNNRKIQQADCSIVKEEVVSEDPSEWSVAQTLVSITRMDPSISLDDIKALRDHKVDGIALLKLNFHDLVTYCQVKVGPAIKLNSIVKMLKAKREMQTMSESNVSNISYF